jgi:2OG-Fe(II) oxygenase superfamily
MINKRVLESIEQYRAEFSSAEPFRHVVIDDFLEPDRAEQMLLDFPAFDPRHAMNEMGEVGAKAVVENVAEISPFYREFADYIRSEKFLGAITALTGIEGLISDEKLYGGGTHENLNGQELDAHVDFNFDERMWAHRRLNILLYLNKEWDDAWGGAIEVHSDPRWPERNVVKAFTPLFNRCIVFETNEHSWHGFPRIQLPPDKSHLSRKSFSIYLYTKDRPAEEVAPPHTTFYVQRPLPEHIRAGLTLSHEDFETIRQLIYKRDRFIEFYQNRELQLSRDRTELLRQLLVANGTLPQTPPPPPQSAPGPLSRLKHLLRGPRAKGGES